MRYLVLAFLFSAVAWSSQPYKSNIQITNPKDKAIVDRFLKHTQKSPGRVKIYAKSNIPEEHCWKTFRCVQMPLTAYHVTGDIKYLDMFVENFGFISKRLEKSDDGFLGWYGTPIGIFAHPDKPDQMVDVIITSFVAVRNIADFIEIIDAKPELKAKYAKQRSEYLDLAENHLIKKWTVRKNYVDLGKKGAVYRTHTDLKPVKANLTQPTNKHAIIISALTAMYRITGNDDYMRKAVKLATYFKHCLSLKDGHYEWNYWNPGGDWDMHPEDSKRWKMWIGLEHKGGYYALSLSQAIEMYNHGLVFTEEDIKRFIKTQLDATWNGDFEKPVWFRVDGKKGKMKGEYIAPLLAPYNKQIEDYCFNKNGLEKRLEESGHGWRGGPVAQNWIYRKFVYLPRVKTKKQIYIEAGNRFRINNKDFLKEHEFSIKGSGYKAPKTPGNH